uniref:Uncharacterized protein n=1 Tax=Anguilla anguilla TaxID=7936 RepID=A0A0E9UF91_ANGAN
MFSHFSNILHSQIQFHLLGKQSGNWICRRLSVRQFVLSLRAELSYLLSKSRR